MMNNISDICSAVKRIAWGFFFIFIHINIATIDILPDWVGFAMIVSALGVVIADEESLRKLRPVGIILIMWNVIEWVFAIFGAGMYTEYISVIPMVLNMYLIYNLFKNLSVWAKKYSCTQEKSLILWGTVYMVFSIVSTGCGYISLMLGDVATFMIVGFVLIAVGLTVMIGILVTLFSFSRTLKEKAELPMYQTMYRPFVNNIESQENV